jgi:hypothetical protein
VGCIDCTHVAIVPPARNNPQLQEHIFVKRKGYHSLNCQLVKCALHYVIYHEFIRSKNFAVYTMCFNTQS